MDLPCQQWVRHVEQKWTGLGPEGRERFSILADINDIFNNALSLTQPDDLNTLSIISDKYSVKKSPEPASEFREQGNLSFKVKDYTSAALFYSKGICHADKNTEQLSLCYANRSAALFYLTLYKECLEDIRQALEAGYPSHLRDKLITRKTACLNQLSKLEKSNTPAPNNPPPPSTSHGVSVYFSPGKGRHLLATENKLAGDVVLVDEAYGCVLIPVTTATLYKKLHGGPPSDMWESCEDDRGAWKPEMSMLGATVLRHLMQLRCNAQAVTAIRVTEETGTSVQPSNEIRIATAIFPVLSLLNHSCSPNTSIFFTTGFINNQLTQFSGSSQGDHSETLHSGVTVTLRTSKDLMAGQEILHCYGPHCSRMTVKERQRLLLEQYFFTCDCVACLREHAENKTSEDRKTALGLKCENCEQPLQAYMERYVCSQPSCSHQITSAEVQKKLQGLQNLLDQAIHLMERDRSDDALRILKSASSQADSILTDTHPVKGELADATARVYATNGDWSRAASHLKLSIVAIKAQYGEDCVELGRQFFKLAQLHFNGGDRRATLSVIPKARRLLSLHCGPLCEELQELQEMEHCLK
ncbi:SET and MYND domain-containing protein 4 isoform X2 [Triplophysa dalaica]|uniref:SET and MYND domain-containing protein 4 isoform X2 n=1 Tax=Triplophysa dalaica TaxID=1582913 RepID=UPI0024DF6103|nr:SET and MYND domain-containing protein 4 isoform X2 [Triplophysa dalaica]